MTRPLACVTAISAVLVLSLGCAREQKLEMTSASISPRESSGSTLELTETGGKLRFHQDLELLVTGGTENRPTGRATLRATVFVESLELGDVVVPVKAEQVFPVTLDITAERGLIGLELPPLKLVVERELDAATAAGLRPMCGKSEKVWLNAHYETSTFESAPAGFTSQPTKGTIHNTLTLQEIEVKCAEPEAPPPG